MRYLDSVAVSHILYLNVQLKGHIHIIMSILFSQYKESGLEPININGNDSYNPPS
jgi:hypothetical protein